MPGIGKSHLRAEMGKHGIRVADLDSAAFSWLKNKDGQTIDLNGNVVSGQARMRNPNFAKDYAVAIQKALAENDLVFVSAHEETREALKQEKIEFDLVRYRSDMKKKAMKRVLGRDTNQPNKIIAGIIDRDWKKWMATIDNPGPKNTYVLQPGQYLQDVLGFDSKMKSLSPKPEGLLQNQLPIPKLPDPPGGLRLKVNGVSRVVSAMAGAGKSYLKENMEKDGIRVADSDSSEFSWLKDGSGDFVLDNNGKKVRNPNFITDYMAHIRKLLSEYEVVFVSSHDLVRDGLTKEGIPFDFVRYRKDMKQEAVDRITNRNTIQDNAGIARATYNFWNDWMKSPDREGPENIYVLQPGQHLDDVLRYDASTQSLSPKPEGLLENMSMDKDKVP
jgi:hypothetical protein